MKANKLIFCALTVSFLSTQSMSPSGFIAHTNLSKGRMPASEAAAPVETPNKAPVEVVTCKAESKGEKLEADVKKSLEDKEAVLKQVEGIKKDEEKKPSDNSDLIALMSQITTMFSTQMQSQMQMQIQMMNMLSQMQNNMMPQMSPYAMDFSQGFNSPYSQNDSIGLGSLGVGIPAYGSQWSGYQSPYSIMPNMNRQPAQAPSDFGFSFNSQAPTFSGFDFSQTPGKQSLTRASI